MKCVSALVLASAAVAAVAAEDLSVVFTYPEENYDFTGKDIGHAKAAKFEDCANLCGKQPFCGAYSWNEFEGGTCWFKQSRGDAVAKPGVKASVMWPWPMNLTSAIKFDTDFDDHDIANAAAPSPDQCIDACKKTKDCRVFSWSNYNKGTCWLKSKPGKQIVKADVASGFAYPDAQLLLQKDNDFPGHDIGNKPAGKPEECFEICSTYAGCRAFTWSNYQGGTCWLKAAAAAPEPTSGAISGLGAVKQTHACTFDTSFGKTHTDNNGANLASVAGVADPMDCCQICGDVANCKMSTWSDYNGGTCWLKSSIGQASKAAGKVQSIKVLY